MEMIFAILLCLAATTFGAPQRFSRIYDANRQIQRQQDNSYESYESPTMTYTIYRGAPRFAKTKQGIIGLAAKNALSRDQRNQFLPIMKALVKVMETSTPAPEDVNTLLVLTRDLTSQIPEGISIPSFLGAGFGGFGLNGLENMGLAKTGDVIVD